VGYALGKGRHAQTTKEIAMSGTTERILIVVFLIVAVLLAMRDAHAGMIGKLNSYAGSRSHNHVIQQYEQRDSASMPDDWMN
jgi:hypothetical protein